MKRVFVALAAATAVLGVIAPAGRRRHRGLSRQRSCPAGLQLPERRGRDRLRQNDLRPGRREDELCATRRPGEGRLPDRGLLPGAYLINQAVNELCPAQIWQLRQSAAGYTYSASITGRVLIPLPHGCAADGRSHACSSRD